MNRETFLLHCHELTEFCLKHGGKCFSGWSREKIFWFMGFHALAGTLFVNIKNGLVKAIGVAWLDDADKIIHRDRTGEYQFNWKLPKKGDSVLISGVIGDRESCHELYEKVMKKWPFVKRFFTWRDSMLVEIQPETMERFANE